MLHAEVLWWFCFCRFFCAGQDNHIAASVVHVLQINAALQPSNSYFVEIFYGFPRHSGAGWLTSVVNQIYSGPFKVQEKEEDQDPRGLMSSGVSKARWGDVFLLKASTI